MAGVHVRRKIIIAGVRCDDHSALPYSYYFQIYKQVKHNYHDWYSSRQHYIYICSLSLVIFTRTTYTSLSLRVGLKLRRKSEGLAYEKRRKSIPLAYHTPKNRPPGARTPNSKSLTEALHLSSLRAL